jgi:hypothetical protein
MPLPDLDFYLLIYRKANATSVISEVFGKKPVSCGEDKKWIKLYASA